MLQLHISDLGGVLFDLDGVLLNSEHIYSHFWDEVDRRYPTGVPNFSSVIKGSNLHEILSTYYPDDELKRCVTQMLDEFQRHMQYDFFPEAIAFVKELRRAHTPMCVVTSSDQKKMQSLYAQHPHFRALFNAIITGDMVRQAKPAPECFLLGAESIGVDIKSCVVFEDSVKGLMAGMESGATVV